jgi:DNA primase
MSKSDVEKIKEKLDITEVLGTYLKIEKAGANFKARCPFHNEKTPSFFISPDRNSYYCFGCGVKGDIFSFVQEYESVDFREALKILADRAGIELENRPMKKDSHSDRLYKILEDATSYFESKLKDNSEALLYLKKRGLKIETIKDWRVGYAPTGWQNLYDYLHDKKYTDREMELVGLIKKGDKGNYYDRFRSRIMFPIFDKQGRPIAFSGRIFGSDESDIAKYLNSPETEVFKKSEILYGFHIANKSIRKFDFSILVEGQMDILMAHQAGYSNTVASSGTALTEDQLKMLNRISPKVVIAYDSDSAGFNASEKAWKTALSLGMDVKIAPLPKDTDPADILKSAKGTEEWKELIKKSEHIIDVLIRKITETESDPRKRGKMVQDRIIPHLFLIESNIDKDHFIKRVAQSFNIKEEAISKDVENYNDKNTESVDVKKSNSTESSNYKNESQLTIEKRILGILYWQKNKENAVIDIQKTEEKIKDILGEEYQSVVSDIEKDLEEVAFLLEKTFENETIIQKEVQGLLSNLKLKKLNKDREDLLLSLRSLEKTGDSEKKEEKENMLLKKISDISKEIQNINLG